ncbi:MAG: hypothetical protein HKN08_11420 [Gammaproteobacteria bacterium]|nr:hypothetical protein [Gammaproteobacteria bacterium]
MIGNYLLLRRVFQLTIPATMVGAVIFLFNGFFLSRMLIGHLTYQIFPLVPLLIFGLVQNPEGRGFSIKNEVLRVICCAWIFAYMIFAGAANFIVPVIYAVFLVWLLATLMGKSDSKFLVRTAISGLLGIIFCSVKLYPTIKFMSLFERDLYPLPGFDGFIAAVKNIFQTLFSIGAPNVSQSIVNFPYPLGNYELNFQVTPVPLFLLLIFGFVCILRGKIKKTYFCDLKGKITCGLLLVLCIAPVLINSHYPGWDGFLKEIPYIKNSSSLFRWIAVYIPLVCVASAISIDRIFNSNRTRMVAALVCIGSVIVINALQDRSDYFVPIYDPVNIMGAWNANVPNITHIGNLPGSEQQINYIQRNDVLVIGMSQLICYEPVFGYDLEDFPENNLQTGSIVLETDGKLNVNNPACMVYPEVNQCLPGDSFMLEDRQQVNLFASYKSHDFMLPVAQDRLTYLSIFSLLLSILIVISLLSVDLYKIFRN